MSWRSPDYFDISYLSVIDDPRPATRVFTRFVRRSILQPCQVCSNYSIIQRTDFLLPVQRGQCSNMSKAARLAELRALRASGKTRLASYQVEEEEDLYDEVDDEGYKKVVRSRLDRDDFIVDDNGEGYADDGREEWMGERRYDSASGSEEEAPLKGKAG